MPIMSPVLALSFAAVASWSFLLISFCFAFLSSMRPFIVVSVAFARSDDILFDISVSRSSMLSGDFTSGWGIRLSAPVNPSVVPVCPEAS